MIEDFIEKIVELIKGGIGCIFTLFMIMACIIAVLSYNLICK